MASNMTSVLAAILLLSAAPAAAAAPTQCKTAAIERSVVEAAQKLADRSDLAGVSIAMGIGDGYRWERAFGLADVERNVPMSVASKVRIGSVSKVVTTAALARMKARGEIDFDAPIQRYVPRVPVRQEPMTLRHLTSHTAGIRHYVANDRLLGPWGTWDRSHVIAYKTPSDALDIFIEDDLLFPSGKGFFYSTYAWTVVSAAMEAAAGKPFLDLMARELAELGLKETVPDHTYDLIADRAVPYEPDANGTLRLAPAADRSFSWAGGGYLSTARDLVTLATAHRPGPLLSESALNELFTRVPIEGGGLSDHGIGWMVNFGWAEEDVRKAKPDAGRDTLLALYNALPGTVWHSGGAPGGSSYLYYDPETETAVAAIANSYTDGEAWGFSLELLALQAFSDLKHKAASCRTRKR